MNQAEIAAGKKAMRRKAALLLASMTEEEVSLSSSRIASAVLASPLYREARSLFSYISVGREPDTRGIIADALGAGKAVYVPKCLRPPRMLAVRLRDPEVLVPGWMDIPEPREAGETAVAFDLILVPCVALSVRGERLGHGAGYYDAFLKAHPSPSLCLCHARLMADRLPVTPDDAPVDAFVSGDAVRFF